MTDEQLESLDRLMQAKSWYVSPKGKIKYGGSYKPMPEVINSIHQQYMGMISLEDITGYVQALVAQSTTAQDNTITVAQIEQECQEFLERYQIGYKDGVWYFHGASVPEDDVVAIIDSQATNDSIAKTLSVPPIAILKFAKALPSKHQVLSARKRLEDCNKFAGDCRGYSDVFANAFYNCYELQCDREVFVRALKQLLLNIKIQICTQRTIIMHSGIILWGPAGTYKTKGWEDLFSGFLGDKYITPELTQLLDSRWISAATALVGNVDEFSRGRDGNMDIDDTSLQASLKSITGCSSKDARSMGTNHSSKVHVSLSLIGTANREPWKTISFDEALSRRFLMPRIGLSANHAAFAAHPEDALLVWGPRDPQNVPLNHDCLLRALSDINIDSPNFLPTLGDPCYSNFESERSQYLRQSTITDWIEDKGVTLVEDSLHWLPIETAYRQYKVYCSETKRSAKNYPNFRQDLMALPGYNDRKIGIRTEVNMDIVEMYVLDEFGRVKTPHTSLDAIPGSISMTSLGAPKVPATPLPISFQDFANPCTTKPLPPPKTVAAATEVNMLPADLRIDPRFSQGF